MRGDPFYEFPDYDYSSSSNHPEIAIFIFLILLVIYINRIVNLQLDDYLVNIIFTSISCILLFSSNLVKNSPIYFDYLRFIIALSSLVLFMLTLYYNTNKFTWVLRILLFVIFILFNPIVPFYFQSRKTWGSLDFAAIIILISNNIYSYTLAVPFSDKRRERIYNFQNKLGGKLEFLFPRNYDGYAGWPLLIIIYVILLIFLIASIVSLFR